MSIKFMIIFSELYFMFDILGENPKPNKSGIINLNLFFNRGYILLNSKKLLSNP